MWGGLFGGLGGVLFLAGLWLMPFVEITLPGSHVYPPDPIAPGEQSLLKSLEIPSRVSRTATLEEPILLPAATGSPTPTATPTSTEPPTPELGECTFEASVSLFCRVGSDTRFKAIDSFTPGQTAPVLGMSSDGFYWYVLGPLSGQMCTVPSAERYGTTSGDCSGLPQFTPMPTQMDSPTPTLTVTPTPLHR